MSTNINKLVFLALWGLFGSWCGLSSNVAHANEASTVTTTTSDGLTIYGETYFGSLGNERPLILLFHQGGSNGRGEYAEIASWLNRSGYRAIAWDQRSGGDRFGNSNRTVSGLPQQSEYSYCDAAPDLQAALDFVKKNGVAERVVVWGSSYSAALVFELAANNPDSIAGVIAFSPASGGPMANCRARQWINEVGAPSFVLRPASEMERESSIEQQNILTATGTKFMVVENAVHGSSMLNDARTNHDMSEARAAVQDWLGKIAE